LITAPAAEKFQGSKVSMFHGSILGSVVPWFDPSLC
jgi:hypothetical protein